MKLISVDNLQHLVKLVVASGFVKGYNPLSLMLVGDYGVGKTSIISSFSAKNIQFLSDLSSTGVLDIMQEKKAVTHMVIPDFTKVTQKNRNTSNTLIGTLNSATEEGIQQIRLKNTKIDLKGRKIGLITSTTRESWAQNHKAWKSIGFVSRMLVASYSYSQETYDKIMESIYDCEFLVHANLIEKLKRTNGKELTKVTVKISSNLARKLNNLKKNTFRNQKQLQSLACCNALINGRTEVLEEDISKILELNEFLNLKYKKI